MVAGSETCSLDVIDCGSSENTALCAYLTYLARLLLLCCRHLFRIKCCARRQDIRISNTPTSSSAP
jgi:hypothetical protein